MFSCLHLLVYVTKFDMSTPLTQKYGKSFKHNKNNSLTVISPLLQKIRLDKLKQRAYDWKQGARGWVIYLSNLNNITILNTWAMYDSRAFI